MVFTFSSVYFLENIPPPRDILLCVVYKKIFASNSNRIDFFFSSSGLFTFSNLTKLRVRNIFCSQLIGEINMTCAQEKVQQ